MTNRNEINKVKKGNKSGYRSIKKVKAQKDRNRRKRERERERIQMERKREKQKQKSKKNKKPRNLTMFMQVIQKRMPEK